jgi:hypothetical protein
MSVKLNRPPKPEESQKNSNFNRKTIPYPGFEPGTSGLAVGRHNHCTIWVGLVIVRKTENKTLVCVRGEFFISNDIFLLYFELEFASNNAVTSFSNNTIDSKFSHVPSSISVTI